MTPERIAELKNVALYEDGAGGIGRVLRMLNEALDEIEKLQEYITKGQEFMRKKVNMIGES